MVAAEEQTPRVMSVQRLVTLQSSSSERTEVPDWGVVSTGGFISGEGLKVLF